MSDGPEQAPEGETGETVVVDEGRARDLDAPGPDGSADAPGSAPPGEVCVTVAVGASAGGLDAYTRLLQNMPAEPGVALVLVQHLDPTHESLMVELLSRHSPLPVVQAEDDMEIEANRVYMIPPNRFLRMAEGRLYLEDPVPTRGLRLPIDHFFRSMAADLKERCISVVLTGTGSDGAEGTRIVKAEGGMTVVEDPLDAEYDGMPRAAVATGSVDHVLAIERIPEAIVSFAEHPYVRNPGKTTLAERAPNQFRAILNVLRAHTDQDFSRYKSGTLTRRIERRMGIRRIGDPEGYLRLLREDQEEVHALFRDLLIGVTRFFRTPDAWDDLAVALRQHLTRKEAGETVRVWVPGCSTGEEAYSLAILLQELQEELDRPFDVQVFATDIDPAAIETARKGLYPDGVIGDLSPHRAERFFHREGDNLRVRKRLREACIFAAQNLLTDAPFSNLDLVSCRNLLIYLDSDIQSRVIEMFHFALAEDGILFLGSSESTGKRKQLFSTVAQKSRIYRKRGRALPGRGVVPLDARKSPRHPGRTSSGSGERKTRGTVDIAKTALLEQYAPASVVIDQSGTIQYIQGPVRDFLDFPRGEPQLDLPSMALHGLKSKARQLLRSLQSTGKPQSVVAPRVRRESGYVAVRLEGRPLPPPAPGGLFLVSFLDADASPSPVAPPDPPDPTEGVSEGLDPEAGIESDADDLALELQATREDLQSTIEELESSNEELKASNEEVMSMNEELQSTNEELETSREELQSLNEELSTVNSQLNEKIDELEDTTDDLQNFLASTDIATLFLDPDLRIRRFTPATIRIMNIRTSDVGRPVSDLSSSVADPRLLEDARSVLSDLAPIQREVGTAEDGSYIRRITPFRTSEDRIQGVVVTYTDITPLKQATDRIEYREAQQAATARIGRLALTGASIQEVLDRAVREVAAVMELDLVKVLCYEEEAAEFLLVAGVGWSAGLVGEARVSAGLDSQAGFTLQTGAPVVTEDLPHEKRFQGPELLTDHGVVAGISVLIGPESEPWGILGAHHGSAVEFTSDDSNFLMAVANVLWECIGRKEREEVVRRQLSEIDAIYRSAPIGLCFLDEELRFVRVNEELAAMNGRTIEEHLGRTFREVVPQLAETVEAILREVIESGEPALGLEVDGPGVADEGTKAWLASYDPVEVDGTVRGINTAVVDITHRRRMEERLQEARDMADSANAAKSQFLANMSHEIRSPLTAILGFAEFVEERVADDRVRSMVRAIRSNSDHLRRILDDILDLSKVEAGKLEARAATVELAPLFTKIRSLMTPQAASAGLTLEVESSDPVPETIRTDPQMLRQIILNLVANGLKFTQEGGVTVTVDCDAEREMLHVAIQDTGNGIAPEHLDRIFEPFEQVDASSTRSAGGTGLGLSISRRLAEALGGSLTAESELGVGSTFRLSLPTGPLEDVDFVPLRVDVVPSPSVEPRELPRLEGRVLVVDDVEDIQFLLTELLEATGCEAVAVADGLSALNVVTDEEIDAVLMDIQMPGMDGLSATALLREKGFEGPIIAVSAGVFGPEREQALEAGCDDFISKPIEPRRVLTTLAEHMGQNATPGLDVLYVEDDETYSEVTRIWLEKGKHRVRAAASGKEAIEAVGDFTPDIVLMDHGLPDVAAAELVRRLREVPGVDSARFVCLTGRGEDEIEWREMGFDAFLQKPARLEEIEKAFGIEG